MVVLGIAFVPYVVQILESVDDALTNLSTTLNSYSIPPVVTVSGA